MTKDFRSDVEFNNAVTVKGNLTASDSMTTLSYTYFVSSDSTGVVVLPSSPLIKLTSNSVNPNA